MFLQDHGYAVAPFSVETSDYAFDAVTHDALDRLLEAMTPAQQEEAARRYDAAKRAEEKQPAPLMRNESAPAGPQKAPRPR